MAQLYTNKSQTLRLMRLSERKAKPDIHKGVFHPCFSLEKLLWYLPEFVWIDDKQYILHIGLCQVSYFLKDDINVLAWASKFTSLYDAILDTIEWLINEGLYNKEIFEQDF